MINKPPPLKGILILGPLKGGGLLIIGSTLGLLRLNADLPALLAQSGGRGVFRFPPGARREKMLNERIERLRTEHAADYFALVSKPHIIPKPHNPFVLILNTPYQTFPNKAPQVLGDSF